MMSLDLLRKGPIGIRGSLNQPSQSDLPEQLTSLELAAWPATVNTPQETEAVARVDTPTNVPSLLSEQHHLFLYPPHIAAAGRFGDLLHTLVAACELHALNHRQQMLSSLMGAGSLSEPPLMPRTASSATSGVNDHHRLLLILRQHPQQQYGTEQSNVDLMLDCLLARRRSMEMEEAGSFARPLPPLGIPSKPTARRLAQNW